MTKLDQIAALADDYAKIEELEHLRSVAKNLVMSRGNPNSPVMFIGEAPGADEDEQGKPFVGASGRLLDGFLNRHGIPSSEVYITNLVKYRPTSNRTPFTHERELSWPVLEREIEIVNPLVICTLGATPLKMFLPLLKVSGCHGHPFPWPSGDCDIFPMWHPAAILRDKTLVSEFDYDMKKLASYVGSLISRH